MPPSDARSSGSLQESVGKLRPSMAFVVLIFGALIAFEIFNYSTTDHALRDLLGDIRFLGISWSTILALAFCGIDFAGIARLFTPEQGTDEPKEVWYLFGAWLLAATMNAILTWWGVSMAVANHTMASSAVVDQQTLTSVVPVFVAIMVWVIRILIIGTLSSAMDRLMHHQQDQRPAVQMLWSDRDSSRASAQPAQSMRSNVSSSLSSSPVSARPPASRAASGANSSGSGSATNGSASSGTRYQRPVTPEDLEYAGEPVSRSRSEPTYHSVSMSGRPSSGSRPGGQGNDGTGRYRR